MSRQFAYKFYHSKAWKHTRNAYMQEIISTTAGMCPPGMCEQCFTRGEMKPAEIVHHIRWLTPHNIDNPDITLNTDNLMRVCRDCHAEIHKSTYANKPKKSVKPRVRFGPNGEVLPINGTT